MTTRKRRTIRRGIAILATALTLAATVYTTATALATGKDAPRVIIGFVDKISHDQHGRPVALVRIGGGAWPERAWMSGDLHLPAGVKEGSTITITIASPRQ